MIMMDIPLAPIFFPTPEEFSDSLAYLAGLVKKGVAKEHGIIKIIPPEDFKISRFHHLKGITVTPRIQVLSELSLKNKSLLYSEEKKALMENRNKLRKLNWHEIICQVCEKAGDDPRLLLCDGCNSAYHTYCLTPSLNSVPRGEWFCPQCRNTHMSGGHGFEHSNTQYSLEEFATRARHFKTSYFRNREKVPLEEVECEFWRLVACSPYDERNRVVVEYGADLSGVTAFLRPDDNSLTQLDANAENRYETWNLNKLPVHRDSALRFIQGDISGMKSPWCYAGTCFSCFCWHVEDHWTYSINYNHFGDAKTWYGVPAEDAMKLEKALRAESPTFYDKFPTLMHNLNTMLNPLDAMRAGVRVCKAYQMPGEFVVTFPRAYHAGFNQGFNFAEAVNFCPPDWMLMGRLCIDSYRAVARACVFSHSQLCITMTQRCEELSIPFLIVLLQEMDALLQQIQTDLNHKAIAKMGFDLRKARVDKSAMKAHDDECHTCFKCNSMLYEVAVSCACTKGKMSCIQHCLTLCRCPVDNRKKRLYMSHSLNELNQLRDKVFQALTTYYTWRCQVRHIASIWRSANTDTKPTLSEQSSFAYEDLCPNTQLGIDLVKVKEEEEVEELRDNDFEEAPPLLEAMEDLALAEENASHPVVEEEPSDEELEALNDVILECFPFKQRELEWPVPDAADLMRKRTRTELVQLSHVGTLHSYPSSDRAMLSDMLTSMDGIVRRVLSLLKPFTNANPLIATNHHQEKVEIHDFMCLIHQMRMLPFDFEALQGPMEALCKEVERVQHAVLELESRINQTLYSSHEDIAQWSVFECLLNEIHSMLCSAEQLSVKINGLAALEEVIPSLKWLHIATNYLQSAISSPWESQLVQQLIGSGHELPTRPVVARLLLILEARYRDGEELAQSARAILCSMEEVKPCVDSAKLLCDKSSSIGITFHPIEELKAAICRTEALQKTHRNVLNMLQSPSVLRKVSLTYLQELIQASERLPLSFSETDETRDKLKMGMQHITDIEQLFFSANCQLNQSTEITLDERQKRLLKLILPRSIKSFQRMESTARLDELADGDSSNVTVFLRNFAQYDVGDEQALLRSYEEMSHLEKNAMLLLREKNKRKSDVVSSANNESFPSPRYCFCNQLYDESKSMVECELCAEWYHDACLQSFECSWIKNESQQKDEALIHSFLCPVCQRSLRPDNTVVENILSQWESIWPQSTIIDMALQAILSQVKRYREHVDNFMSQKAGPHLSNAWSECLKLFSSNVSSTRKALQQNNKQTVSPRSLRSQNAFGESKPEKMDSESNAKTFRAKDLNNVKTYCHQWLAQFVGESVRRNCTSPFNMPAVTGILSVMESYVVEGNILEISCVEAKAVALIFQILQSDVMEKENAMERVESIATKPVLSCENQGKRSHKNDRTPPSKSKGRGCTSNSANQSHKRSAPLSEKAQLRSHVSSKKLRATGRKSSLCHKVTLPSRTDPKTIDKNGRSLSQPSTKEGISNSRPSNLRSSRQMRRSKSPLSSSSVDSTCAQKPPLTSAGRQRRKTLKMDINTFSLSTSTSDESDAECALGRGCVIHNRRNIRNVLWIQCDKCLCWYHYICVGLKAGTRVSEEYICNTCSKAVVIFDEIKLCRPLQTSK